MFIADRLYKRLSVEIFCKDPLKFTYLPYFGSPDKAIKSNRKTGVTLL